MDAPDRATEQAGDPTSWGRIADDGAVFVRLPEGGERQVGSWQAGDAAAGLAHFARRYADLVVEVDLLEQRLATGAADPRSTMAGVERLTAALPTAAVVGDLGAVERRLAAVRTSAQHILDQARVAKAAEHARAAEAKRALAEEAEKLAAATSWKATGERFREIMSGWRDLHGVDRKIDKELWKRVVAARDEFVRRRSAHFAELASEREQVARVKEKLVAEAEGLSASADWGPTATRLKALMAEWKAAGHAARDVDDALWQRFRAAQDTFFARRGEVFAERDAGLRANQEVKEALLAEAEALEPETDVEGATAKLREIQERWDAAGKVPREAMGPLERRMQVVEERFRELSEARWRQPDPASSPLVTRLRESVSKLERKIERARAAGRDAEAAEAEAALATQREWLAQAERG